MQPIRILTLDFNLIDEVDDYDSLILTRRFHKPGEFESVLHNEFAKEFKEERLIIVGNNVRKSGIIRHIEKSKGDSDKTLIKGYSLSSIIGRRITVPPVGMAYDRMTADAETIMKEYVDRNCVNPVDPSRKIPNLVIAENKKRGKNMFYQTRYKQLNEELAKISEVSGLGWEVYLDYENKQFVFDVYEGLNLTASQSERPPVIFSVDFDNVGNQTYTDSALTYKNRAYVAGQGEGAEREVVEVGENETGLNRIETFVDARDIENVEDLPEHGSQKLAEFSKIQSFETEILPYSNFVYEQDWDLGDIVTTQEKEWGETLDARVSEIREIYEPGNISLETTFGKPIPGLIEKIKQEIDQPHIEPSSGVSGWNDIEDKPEEFPPAPHTHIITDVSGLQNELNSKETPQGAQEKVDAHANLTNNPHGVTKDQVGLSNVDNVQQASLADFAALASTSEIIETGENQNGEYIRWANGFQVCYTTPANVTYHSARQIRGGAVLPSNFVDDPVCLVGVASGNSGALELVTALRYSVTNQRIIGYAVRGQDFGEVASLEAFIVAFGRWK